MSKILVLLFPFALACTSVDSGRPTSGQGPGGPTARPRSFWAGLTQPAQPAQEPAEEPADEPAEDLAEAEPAAAPQPAAPAQASAPGSGGICSVMCDRVASCGIATEEACLPACAQQVPQLTAEQEAQVTAAMGDLSCDDVSDFAAQTGSRMPAAGQQEEGSSSPDQP
jgi:hypothetical protein